MEAHPTLEYQKIKGDKKYVEAPGQLSSLPSPKSGHVCVCVCVCVCDTLSLSIAVNIWVIASFVEDSYSHSDLTVRLVHGRFEVNPCR